MGELDDDEPGTFEFKGLPVGKYDLIACYDLDFYEGLKLENEKNTLTPEDVKKIEFIIQKNEPFFTKKFIHRVEGQTGRGNFARCLCTYFRDDKSMLLFSKGDGDYSRADYRRTYKLVMLKDVGPGWQVVRARDLYPVWMKPQHPLPKHHYTSTLSQIRVADTVKDVGDIDVTR
jgi:hypothetical protein